MATKLAIVCVFFSIVCVSYSENVKDRLKSALEMVGEDCREAALTKDCSPFKEEDNTQEITTFEDRRNVCKTYNKKSAARCLKKQKSCNETEVHNIFRKVCDFKEYEKIAGGNGMIRNFSKKCQLKFDDCKGEVKELFEMEDYCEAFKEDEALDKCFEESEGCDNDEDEDLFEDIRDAACGEAGQLVVSLAAMVACLVTGRLVV